MPMGEVGLEPCSEGRRCEPCFASPSSSQHCAAPGTRGVSHKQTSVADSPPSSGLLWGRSVEHTLLACILTHAARCTSRCGGFRVSCLRQISRRDEVDPPDKRGFMRSFGGVTTGAFALPRAGEGNPLGWTISPDSRPCKIQA